MRLIEVKNYAQSLSVIILYKIDLNLFSDSKMLTPEIMP